MSPSQAAGGDGSRQQAAPNRSHKSPERPRGGKSRRTLIESACTACQKRKSRCDGTRPSCSRCQALHTECGYNAEEGESRWSALRRRNCTLERERDEARDLIAQIQSRSTPEAHELVHHLRTNPQASDLGTLIHDAVSAMSDHASPQQQQLQQVQGESGPPAQSLYYGQQSTQPYQPQQFQQTAQPHPQQQRSAQRNDQGVFSQPNYALTAAGPQLPPIRSIVDVPAGGHNSSHLPQPFPHMTQRNMSLESNMSSTSYSSLSSSDGIGGQPLSPMEHPHSS